MSNVTRKRATILFLSLFAATAQAAGTAGKQNPWKAPAEQAARENPVAYNVDSVNAGEKLFAEHCLKCHGYYGEGNGVVGATLNKKPANLLKLAGKKSEGEFAWKIAEGRGNMPSFRSTLSEEQIWTLVNFVESLENEQGSAGN